MTLDLDGLRVAGGAMLGIGLVLPLFGHGAGLPCPLRSLTGIPCPLCGMTTSVVAALHGDVVASVSANPFGVVAVLCAVGLLLRRDMQSASVPVALLGVGVLASWVFELARFHFI
jgi:hypothetical protein